MPELPEVETTKNAVLPFKGKILKQIIVNNSSLRWPVDQKAIKKIKDVKILSISRRAKYIFLDLDNLTIIIHLGMTGTFRIQNLGSNETKKHDHIIFEFKDKILIFNDPRRFGSLHITKNPNEHILIKNLGVEPLSRRFNKNFLFKLCSETNLEIKKLLMDQRKVVGVGNIYASESLYLSSISPLRKSKEINLDECEKLVKSIKKILKYAIKMGGTTLKDFYSADGSEGYFKLKLNVYGLENQNCKKCSNKIEKIIIGQRSTFYCKECQT